MNPALQGYLAAIGELLEQAGPGSLSDAAGQVDAVSDLIDGNPELALVVNDGSIAVGARRAVLDDLLEGRVRPEVKRLVDRTVAVVPASDVVSALHWCARQLGAASAPPTPQGGSEPDSEPVLGRLAARNRVNGYAAAVFEQSSVEEIEEIEDQLFRFARTVESNRALRTALGDRDLPVAVRQGVVADLLRDKSLDATRRIAAYAIRGGRARDVVSTLDGLVVEAARARGWRVARVQSAQDVDEERRQGLGEALGRLTGGPVELQVTVDPALLGGVVVQVGDLLVDSSTRHRIDQLKEHLVIGEAPTRIAPHAPHGAPHGREAADG